MRKARGRAVGAGQVPILILVPRIVLVEQNVKRLQGYGIPDAGVYYGERKDIREITISTYQSAINNLDLIRGARMVVLDEVHLVSESAVAFDSIFDVIVEDPSRAILGLTATINEKDPKYQTILTVAPPVKRYMIKDAVTDGRLAKPVVEPVQVSFAPEEQKIYDEASAAIKDISRKLQTYDPAKMTKMLTRGGARGSHARAGTRPGRRGPPRGCGRGSRDRRKRVSAPTPARARAAGRATRRRWPAPQRRQARDVCESW